MFTGRRPVILMIHEETGFCAASFLRAEATKKILKTIRQNFCLVYTGPTDCLVIGEESVNFSKGMTEELKIFGTLLWEVPVEKARRSWDGGEISQTLTFSIQKAPC